MRAILLGVLSLVAALGLLAFGLQDRSAKATAQSAAPPPARRPALRPETSPLSLPAVLPSRRVSVPILMYHRVGSVAATTPQITRALTVSPQAFRDEMEWIAGHGFHAITQRELFDALELGSPLPAKPVMITFDDGYRDVLWNAAPVLSRLRMRATAYVITGRVSGSDTSFLTWPELHELERLGVEIGSHTVDHVELTGLSTGAALAELRDSRRALELQLGHPVQWFAYPAGAVDAAVVPLVRAAGYVLAVSTRSGDVQDARDPLELHRYEVLDTTGAAGLAGFLGG